MAGPSTDGAGALDGAAGGGSMAGPEASLVVVKADAVPDSHIKFTM